MMNHARLTTMHGRLGPMLAIGMAFLAGGILLGLWVLDHKDSYRAARMYPQPVEIESFELKSASGASFTQANLAGRWNLMFFGFTNCPDVCPDTLSSLATVAEELETKTKSELPQVIFVSVDPERDQGQTLADYVSWFNPNFTAVTGNEEQLKTLTRRLGIVYYRDQPDSETGYYNVDHSSSVLIIDPDGRLVGRFAPPLDVPDVVADLFAITS